jgi:transposase InsO family protein
MRGPQPAKSGSNRIDSEGIGVVEKLQASARLNDCALRPAHGIEGSLSRKGDCWDNTVAESFFGSLKSERVHWRSFTIREEARADIVEYITIFYNSHRLHSYQGYQSPNGFDRKGQLANADKRSVRCRLPTSWYPCFLYVY